VLDDVVTAPAVLEKPEKSSSKDLPLDLAPGCFGFGLLYNRDKEICGGCPFNDECAKRALPIRERLRNEIGLRFPEERKKRAKPAPKAVAEPKAEAKPSQAASPRKPLPSVYVSAVNGPNT
jgi:hypothetical protein